MDYTYIEYFNYYLKEFLNEIVTKFPEFRGNVLQNYRTFLQGKDNKGDLYVKFYYKKINDHLISIAKKDSTIFDKPGVVFIEGVDFYNLWNHTSNTDETRTGIWKYLQLLMIIGRKSIPDHKEILELLQKVGGEINVPAKVKKTLATIDEHEREEAESGGLNLGNLMNLATGLGGMGGGDGLNLDGLMKGLIEGLGNMPDGGQFESFAEDEEGEAGEGESMEPMKSGLFADLAEEMANTFDFDE